jgi:hypothetical protein
MTSSNKTWVAKKRKKQTIDTIFAVFVSYVQILAKKIQETS